MKCAARRRGTKQRIAATMTLLPGQSDPALLEENRCITFRRTGLEDFYGCYRKNLALCNGVEIRRRPGHCCATGEGRDTRLPGRRARRQQRRGCKDLRRGRTPGKCQRRRERHRT